MKRIDDLKRLAFGVEDQKSYLHFLYGLMRMLKPRRVLEIGTYRGASARAMLYGLEDEGIDAELITIDPCVNDDSRALAGEFPNCVVLEGRSPHAVNAIPGMFDFVWLDGDHQGKAPIDDWLAVRTRIGVTGIVGIHDALLFPEVGMDLLEYIKKDGEFAPMLLPSEVGVILVGKRTRLDIRPTFSPVDASGRIGEDRSGQRSETAKHSDCDPVSTRESGSSNGDLAIQSDGDAGETWYPGRNAWCGVSAGGQSSE